MKNVYILQGSNEGDRMQLLDESLRSIETEIGAIQKLSSVYESEPWGFEAKQWFLNRVVLVETDLEPMEILVKLLRIEATFGRTRNMDGTYHSRTLDLDILLIDQMIISLPELIIPHPQLHKRKFTLLPLCDIASEYVHPQLLKPISVLLSECNDLGAVKKQLS
jgi:2-amino-4-hydroxy-6-hydroxymethyldihydropteridine diphosphokinase